jgi:hypothetical protein
MSDSFYIISSLATNGSWERLGERQRFDSEKNALEAVRKLMANRERINCKRLDFYILKAVVVVTKLRR